MIPTIGIMIGAYIVMRAIELLSLADRGVFVKAVAVITMLVAIVCSFSLLMAGNNPRGF